MKDRKCLEDIFLVCFWGPTVTFHGYMYIYIYSLNLGLGITVSSLKRLGHLCSMSTVSPSDVAIHALASKSLQPQVQQQSWQSTTIVRLMFFGPQKKNIFTKMVSWKIWKLDCWKIWCFFLFPSCFLLFYHFLLVSWIVEDSKCCSYPFFGDETNIKVSESLKCWKNKTWDLKVNCKAWKQPAELLSSIACWWLLEANETQHI